MGVIERGIEGQDRKEERCREKNPRQHDEESGFVILFMTRLTCVWQLSADTCFFPSFRPAYAIMPAVPASMCIPVVFPGGRYMVPMYVYVGKVARGVVRQVRWCRISGVRR